MICVCEWIAYSINQVRHWLNQYAKKEETQDTNDFGVSVQSISFNEQQGQNTEHYHWELWTNH